MQVDVITLFPEVVSAPLAASMMGRAQQLGVLQLQVHNLREHGLGRHRQVDDTPYGGGPGMVLRPEPIAAAIAPLKRDDSHVIFMSPQGRRFTQADAARLSSCSHLIFLCGHYEGVDQRIVDTLVDEELSIGDYVLTNGAIAAAVVIDAVVRLLPGVLGHDQSAVEESFGPSGLLDHPHYTKPPVWNNLSIPPVLASGDHGKVARWRREQAVERTKTNRPDLLQ
jgi:tRNA (guanine37-N1)-methyltransferase